MLALPVPAAKPAASKKKAKLAEASAAAVHFVTAGERGMLRTWRTDTAQSTGAQSEPIL